MVHDRTKFAFNGAVSVLLVAASILLVGGIDRMTRNARKVAHIIDAIQRQAQTTGAAAQTAQISEQELNDYIAYRLKRDRHPILDGLTVKLLEGNHVGGTVRFNARTLNLEILLGDALNFDFSGVIDTRDREARFHLVGLRLNGQPVKPQVLEFVLHTAALTYGAEPTGIDDWYLLPMGIKAVSTSKAKATITY
jgi:hypothetical protein